MDKEAIAAEIAQTAGDEKSKDTADALTALVANWFVSRVRFPLIWLLRIVSCRRVVSVDTIRRQFLLGRKDLQFLKAMVQSRHLGMGVGFCLGRGKPPDPCFWPMLELGREITGRVRKASGIGGWLENRGWKISWKPGQRNHRKSESKVVLNVS